MNPPVIIIEAKERHMEELEKLVDISYRGKEADDAHMFPEPRINQKMLQEDMDNPKVTFFICLLTEHCDNINEKKEGRMIGCVRAEKKPNATIRLDMICVHPSYRGLGLGQKLLDRVEQFAKMEQCQFVTMTAIKQRPGILGWYNRQGYQWTGETVVIPSLLVNKQQVDVYVLEKKL